MDGAEYTDADGAALFDTGREFTDSESVFVLFISDACPSSMISSEYSELDCSIDF